MKQVELLNSLQLFNEAALAEVKKDHEFTLKGIMKEMKDLIKSQEEAVERHQQTRKEVGKIGPQSDEEGTGQDSSRWHFAGHPNAQDCIPKFWVPLFLTYQRKKMAPVKKIKAFQKQASKYIFSGANMFWPHDRTYEPVSTHAQEEKLERHMIRFENLDTKTKRNKSEDNIVYQSKIIMSNNYYFE